MGSWELGVYGHVDDEVGDGGYMAGRDGNVGCEMVGDG